MINTEKPKNELQRLQSLYNLQILDTMAEERFDRITRIAQGLFKVPIALVSLIDKDREWFKSKYGLHVQETPRPISFGAHTILQEEIMIVNDAQQDLRFKDNPLVTGEPNIRFYLGCPLQIEGQFNIGTLCLMNNIVPQLNTLGHIDLNIVKELAAAVSKEFITNRYATTDSLTEISNRQGLLDIGKQILKLCNRYDKGLMLLYFDIIQLKSINREFGYDEGDNILKAFAQFLISNFRHSGAVARIEGDKFCVLCPGMLEENIPGVLKRLQSKLALLKTEHPINFAMGHIQYNRLKHFSLASILEEAEQKIYEKKMFH
ncbi:sensor domain-containing diguanylate cyclase [Legionella saoudiensis]|uniref:sensor domain-containing diguanylate cyclase n=1 Tax=Legionella saoudiensis TaxID=1750561 RepID=UPI000731237E|nr:sensor domain-containing diguanylate cyclase [Legionella saoudiensis]